MSKFQSPSTSLSAWKTAGIAALVYLLFYVMSSVIVPRLGMRSVSTASGVPESLDLTALIRQVKTEVNAATSIMIKGGEAPLFQADSLDIEIQFVVRRKAGTETVELVPIGINSEVSSEKVQRIRLTMKALPQKDHVGQEGKIDGEASIEIPN